MGWHTLRPKGDHTRYGLRTAAARFLAFPFFLLLTCHRLPGIFRKRNSSARAQKLLVREREVSLLRIYPIQLTGGPLPFCSSIGNFLLAAAQSFFRSLPSAIFLFSSITNSQVRALSLLSPTPSLISTQANIVPVIATNHTVTIAAELVTMPTLLCGFTRSHLFSRRRMERISWVNVKSPIQLHGPFRRKARTNTCRRSALTQSHQR